MSLGPQPQPQEQPMLGQMLDVHETFCPRCGKETDELVRVDSSCKVVECPRCGKKTYSDERDINCEFCFSSLKDASWRELEPWERVPGSVCSNCKEMVRRAMLEVARGGVYFHCLKCGREGTIVARSAVARHARTVLGAPPPEPVTILLREGCPLCSAEGSS